MSWKTGMRRLMPGVYVDRQEAMHLDMSELLAANGYADTPENRATMEAAAAQIADQVGARLTMPTVDEEDD